MVALKVPTPGTSRSSTRLPVGNIEPPSSPSSDGSMNSSTISAAGKVTPSSSKSPVSCTWPLVIGTWAMMVLLMLACQMRTVQMPFCGMRAASTRPRHGWRRRRPRWTGCRSCRSSRRRPCRWRPGRRGNPRRDRAGSLLATDHALAGTGGRAAHAVDLRGRRDRGCRSRACSSWSRAAPGTWQRSGRSCRRKNTPLLVPPRI